MTREEQIQSLVDRPHESMAVELKIWLSPDEPQGISKIVRTLLALRNQNGGFLVIGFDNRTLQPVSALLTAPELHKLFHADVIQHLVSKYASEPFEMMVDFPRVGDGIVPVISVPGGIISPVACKADLRADDGTLLLREGDLFVRTLNSNGTVSSARASWKDYGPLTARCFENREVDHVRFLTKFVSGLQPEAAKLFAIAVAGSSEPRKSDEPEAQKKILEYGEKRFREIVDERKIKVVGIGFWDVALHIDGAGPEHQANANFLNLLRTSNPELTGWPVWLDSSSFADTAARP
jgi:hypothetical protein